MKLPNVDRRRVRGHVYKYHRITRAKLPADVPEDHPKFIAAWTAEQARTGAPERVDGPAGTLGHAVKILRASPLYLDKSEGYRRIMRRHTDDIAAAYGSAVLRSIRPEHIRADLAKLPANPARARRKAWRLIFAQAIASGAVTTDPTDNVRGPRAPQTDGRLPWSADEIAAFRKRWAIDTPQRLAFELTYYTGARRTDAALMNRGMVGPDGVLTFKQGKTHNPAHVPLFCALPFYADRVTHGHLIACLDAQRPDFMFVVTKSGKPRSPKAFGQWLVKAAQAAGIEGKSAHGLRKNRLTQIAEDRGGVAAVQAWGGHVTLSEAQHYIKAADRKRAVMGIDHDHVSAHGHN